MAEAERKPQGTSNLIGCLALILLWGVLLLHFLADQIWDEEPAVLKWAVIAYGCLVLLGLLSSLVFGKRDERIFALVFLAVVAVVVAVLPRSRDRRADTAVDSLVTDLSTKGAAIEQRIRSLPPIPAKLERKDLEQYLQQADDQLREQLEWSEDLLRRAKELLPRASSGKRQELSQALNRFNEQTRSATEKQDRWIAEVRERMETLKK